MKRYQVRAWWVLPKSRLEPDLTTVETDSLDEARRVKADEDTKRLRCCWILDRQTNSSVPPGGAKEAILV